MTHLDILLPFGLPQPELAADLLRELKTPALATLIGRSASARQQTFDPFSPALPHESWLARQFGLEPHLQSGCVPIAAAAMHVYGLDAGVVDETSHWFMLQPVHIHIARDHLVLTNLRQLQLSEPESRALFDAAKPLFDEIGKPLLYGDAQTWFVRADDWHALQTSTPDAASGHNIDIWSAKGPGERDWRKLQNEVQMLWHAHPVNAEREARGLKPVNSVWLWGGVNSAGSNATAASVYREAFNLHGWMTAFSTGFSSIAATDTRNCNASDVIAASPQHGLLVLDNLLEPTLADNWADWLAQMQVLEAAWFAPLLDALKTGKIGRLSLIATHNTALKEFSAGPYSLRKFWATPSLSKLKS